MSYLEQVVGRTKRLKERRGSGSNVMDIISRIQAKRLSGLPVGEPSQAVINAAQRKVGPAPKGGGNDLDSWIRTALSMTGLDESYLPGIRNMVMEESSGNPRAVNNWDSNAKRGTPSKGLIQTIDPTFQRWALPGYNTDPFDPVSNLVAGIRYAQNRYGNDMLRAGGRKNSQGKYIGY